MKRIQLNNLEINCSGKVESINCNEEVKRRILDLGMCNGTIIKAIYKSPFSDPVAYEFRGSLVALRKEVAELIIIKI